MTRQNFLQLALSLSLAGGSLLAGCGSGGNGGGDSISTVATRAAATLPAGFSIPATELVGATAFGQSALQDGGSFDVTVASEGPTLGFLRHATSGNFALLGFLGAGSAGVSAKGTAVALLFLSLGYASLPAATQKEAIVALEASPVVASLAETVAARVLVNPYAVRDADPALAAALKSAFDALSKGGRAASGLVAKTRAELPPIASITPGDQSNARVLQTDDGQGLIPTNLGRRPAVAYAYRIGFETAAGRADLSPAVRIDGPQELSPVTSWIGSLFTLGASPAWAPVQGRPVALGMEPGASKTYFETVLLMASGKTEAEGEPSFFSQPRYAGELAEWRATRERLNKHAWMSGIFFDLVKSALGGGVVAFEFASVNAKLALFAEIEAAAESQVLAEAAKGAFGRATQLAMERLVGGSILSTKMQEFSIGMIGRIQGAASAALRPFQIASLIGMAELVLGILAAAGTLLALGDLLTTYSDVITSEKGALWQATLLKPSVAIGPKTATLAAGDSQVFSVSAVAVEDGKANVTYKWKTDNPLSNLSERDFVGSPNVGREITTKTKVVTLATTPSTIGTIAVTVEGFVGGTSLGVATATVTMGPAPTPTPQPTSGGELGVRISNLTNHGIGVPSGENVLKDYALEVPAPVPFDSSTRSVPVTFYKRDANNQLYGGARIEIARGTILKTGTIAASVNLSLLYPGDVRSSDAIANISGKLDIVVTGNKVDFAVNEKFYAYPSNPNRENLGYTANVALSGHFFVAT